MKIGHIILLLTSVVILAAAVAVIGIPAYRTYSAIDKTVDILKNVSFGDDPGMRYAYASWLQGCRSYGILDRRNRLCGASRTTSRKGAKHTDIYIIGPNDVTSIEYDGKTRSVSVNGNDQDIFYEFPKPRLSQHIYIDGHWSSVSIIDASGASMTIRDFDEVHY